MTYSHKQLFTGDLVNDDRYIYTHPCLFAFTITLSCGACVCVCGARVCMWCACVCGARVCM